MNRIFYLVIALMLLAVTCAFAEDASSMLTDSVLDGALLIEDSFYQMPIPVSELCADGWTVEGAEDPLGPEEIRTAVTFQKDKLVFDATVMNLYSSEKLMKECHTVALSFGPGISAMTYYPDCEPAGAQFSAKVNMEITRKKLIKELGKADSEIGDSLVWRGNNGKYIQPGHNFKAVYGDKGKELLYFSVEYLTKDFVPAE